MILDYLGGFHVITGFYKTQAGRATVREPDTMMAAEVRVMQGHEPGDVGSL